MITMHLILKTIIATILENSMILAFRAQRGARVNEGDRDLESEPDCMRIRHDLGKCELTLL